MGPITIFILPLPAFVVGLLGLIPARFAEGRLADLGSGILVVSGLGLVAWLGRLLLG